MNGRLTPPIGPDTLLLLTSPAGTYPGRLTCCSGPAGRDTIGDDGAGGFGLTVYEGPPLTPSVPCIGTDLYDESAPLPEKYESALENIDGFFCGAGVIPTLGSVLGWLGLSCPESCDGRMSWFPLVLRFLMAIFAACAGSTPLALSALVALARSLT